MARAAIERRIIGWRSAGTNRRERRLRFRRGFR
jgi:hypothetical protein